MTQLNVLFLLKKLQDFFFFSFVIVVVQLLSHVWLFSIPWTITAHQASLSLIISQVCSNSCPLSLWCHTTISSSAARFSSCPQSFPASKSFSVTWLFVSGGQSIVASASPSVLPMNIQSWYPLGLTGLISLKSKGFSQDYWSEETFHSLGDLLGPEIESGSPALQADSLLFEPPRKTILSIKSPQISLLLIYLLLYNFIALCFNNKGTTKLILSS